MDRFDELTPLEHICLAYEGVHTALLSWWLGDDSPIPFPHRVKLLEGIIGRALTGCTAIRPRTEVMDIDLLVEVEGADQRLAVAFEVKVRSLQGEEQLNKHDQYLSRYPACHKYLLTLIGEHPQSGADWKALRYQTVWEGLRTAFSATQTHQDYIRDYNTMAGRFTRAVELVRTAPDIYAAPFLHSKFTRDLPVDFDAWAKYLRMENTLGLAWMQEVGDQTLARLAATDRSLWRIHVNCPRKEAPLMDVYRIAGQGTQALRMGVQLQNFRLKVFCHPWPYPLNVSEEQNALVESSLLEMRRHMGLPATHKLTPTRNRGFRSFKVFEDYTESLSIPRWADYLAELLGGLGGMAA